MPLLQKGEIMKSTGKNFIIAFLMILAIYQTAELWFGDFSGHNFFSFADKNTAVKVEGDISHTLERIIINLGENKMLCRENGIYSSIYKDSADSAITKVLKKGEVISEGSADWKGILQSKCFIYEYSYTLSKSEAESFFGVSNGNTGKIKSFDTIVLSYDSGSARLRFINSDTLWSMELLANDNRLASDVNSLFNGFSVGGEDIYYISSVQNGFEIFKNNTFIPRWDGQSVSYSYVSPNLQYDGEDKTLLESQVNQFFDNPAGKWSANVNGVLNYSDESTVVKYYPEGVLEYSNYSTGYQTTENDFYTNYLACLAMLEKDKGIGNEYYLRDFRLKGGQYVMYFGYKVNNSPVVMSDELKEKTGMDDYIEFSASYGRVSRYKRYCVVYSCENGESLKASCDFLYAVDDVYNELDESSEPKIDSLSLSYIDNGDNNRMSLWWIIDIEGVEYIRSSEVAAG